MSNQLVVRNETNLTFDEMTRAAKAMATSGYFQDARDVSKAMVKVLAGAEMGLGPFAAMSGIHVIKGKPVLGANLIATLIKNDPRYDYRIKTITGELVEIEFYENGQMVGVSAFDVEQARKAGVGATTPPGKNATMLEMYPQNMLFARAISNGARWYTPGIFGGAPVYTADELGADTDEDGFVISESPVSASIVTDEKGHDEIEDGEIEDAEEEPESLEQLESDPPPQPTNGNAKPTMKPTKKMNAAFHAIGVEKYGDAWDDKRPELVKSVTKGRATSSTHLTRDEMSRLIDGMQKIEPLR